MPYEIYLVDDETGRIRSLGYVRTEKQKNKAVNSLKKRYYWSNISVHYRKH